MSHSRQYPMLAMLSALLAKGDMSLFGIVNAICAVGFAVCSLVCCAHELGWLETKSEIPEQKPIQTPAT